MNTNETHARLTRNNPARFANDRQRPFVRQLIKNCKQFGNKFMKYNIFAFGQNRSKVCILLMLKSAVSIFFYRAYVEHEDKPVFSSIFCCLPIVERHNIR